ncbi:MAG: hypothetical protein Q7U75_00950 [Desulfobacterales bacterium]|nr:hypothetical protein [Desulfobacterales bacterium]
MPEGKYFIYAAIDDGRNPALTVYSPPAVTVHHAVLNPHPIPPTLLQYQKSGYQYWVKFLICFQF